MGNVSTADNVIATLILIGALLFVVVVVCIALGITITIEAVVWGGIYELWVALPGVFYFLDRRKEKNRAHLSK